MSEQTHTSTSLLMRVRAQDPASWQQLCAVYGPTVYRWARRVGLQDSDAADIVQEVFHAVAKSIDQFRREKPGDSFQAWLRTITQNKIRDWYRRRGAETAVGGSAAAQMIGEVPHVEVVDDGETTRIKLRALESIRAEFADHTWQAFWRVVVNGDAPADVAEDLSISVWSAYQAKSRILRRLRHEMQDLL